MELAFQRSRDEYSKMMETRYTTFINKNIAKAIVTHNKDTLHRKARKTYL